MEIAIKEVLPLDDGACYLSNSLKAGCETEKQQTERKEPIQMHLGFNIKILRFFT